MLTYLNVMEAETTEAKIKNFTGSLKKTIEVVFPQSCEVKSEKIRIVVRVVLWKTSGRKKADIEA